MFSESVQTNEGTPYKQSNNVLRYGIKLTVNDDNGEMTVCCLQRKSIKDPETALNGNVTGGQHCFGCVVVRNCSSPKGQIRISQPVMLILNGIKNRKEVSRLYINIFPLTRMESK